MAYDSAMQADIEAFYAECFTALGWRYKPEGRHSDIVNIPKEYLAHGQFWCLYDAGELVGTAAIRTINTEKRTAEMKRLYVLPARQGKGFGGMLFEAALNYAKASDFKKLCADTRRDRGASQHLMKKHGFMEIAKYNDNEFAELFFEVEL